MFLPWFAQEDLSAWEARPVSAATAAGPQSYSFHDVHRRIVAVEPPGPPRSEGPFRILAEAIRNYDIFPRRLGRGVLRRPVQVGDVVGLRYYLAPGLHLFFASRVYEVIEEECRSGFAYETLQGHPEAGQETFAVTKDPQTGAIVASLQAWSQLAPPWPRLLSRLTRPLQYGAGRAALDHFERLILEKYPPVK
ncbi:MAG: DUF1990 family protein [Candidatus Eremiobacteraeota bacterium]|nr:DUF1990 family protein [Candidatus Eremiobacteraeota bacterium]